MTKLLKFVGSLFKGISKFLAFSEALMLTAIGIIWIKGCLGAVFGVQIVFLTKGSDWIAFIFGLLVAIAHVGGLRGKLTK